MYSRFHLPLCVAALWGVAAAVASAEGLPASFTAECEPSGVELTRFDMSVIGQTRVVRNVTVRPGVRVLVLAEESGIDVRMEARRAGVATIAYADNPLRRWGIQRISLDAAAKSFELTAVGKERGQRRVKVRVYALNGFSPADDCLRAQQASSDADASYARGQLITLGTITAASGDAQRAYESALDAYVRAQALFKRRGAMAAQARAEMEHAAALYQGLKRYADARIAAKRASATFAAAGGDYGVDRAKALEASSEMELASAEPGRGVAQSAAQARATEMLVHARALLSEVAQRHQARGELFEQALALNNIGLAFYYQDEYDEAVTAYGRALQVYEKMGERMRQAQTLQNIGLAHNDMAQYPLAFETYARVLELLDESENPKLYADVLNNLALSELETGRSDAALRHYSGALAILVRIQSTTEQARSLHGIGATYYRIGNRTEALKYFERALVLRSATADPVGRIASLRSAADILRDSGRWTEAFERREEALRLASMPGQRARILVELARDAVDSGASERADGYFVEIFRNDAAGDAGLYARALLERAKSSLARKALELAQRDVTQALGLFKVQQILSSTFSALLLQSRIACARADPSSARTSIDAALDVAEQLRRSSNNPTLRASLWQPLRPAFDFKISMISDPRICGGGGQGDAALAALEVSERSRGRALEDFHLLGTLRGASPELSAADRKRAELYEQLAARRLQIETIAETAAESDPRLQALRAEVSSLIRELDILGSEIGSPLRGRGGMRAAVRRAIEMIPPDAAVVEYWLGEKNSYAWLASKGRTKMINLGNTARIDASARELHSALRNFTSVSREERTRVLRELYALIIDPLPDDALRAATIYFVPDGALHTVPFAALVEDSGTPLRFLIDSRDVAVIPSIADAAVPRDEPRNSAGAVLVVADPVYSRDDSRFPRTSAVPASPRKPALTLRGGAADDLVNGPQRWERLTGAGREAAAIVRLLEGADVELLQGFAANRENLLARDLQRYRILHFATHSVADTEAPQLSALVLSTLDAAGAAISGEVFAGDLMLQKLRADLLVLSACDTALGQAISGEGLLGLRYAAHAAGARFVVASLWPVTDTVGEQLMAGLYAGMTRRGRTPVQALSEAMRGTRAQWSDPALWAVFEVSQAGRGETIH